VLSDASNGTPLAAMDSIEITVQRTGAATAIAAKYLAPGFSACTICGCGTQGRIQLRALSRVLPLKTVFAWSRSESKAAEFAASMSAELGLTVTPMQDLRSALAQSDVCVTCTPAKGAFIEADMIRPGMFIAAVGADSPDKQELDPVLVARSKVIADLRKQSSEVGEVHHAIARGLMTASDIYAELGQIVSGKMPGRSSTDETIVFDSTGTALQDAAAASAVYERACAAGIGTRWEVAG
jgi:alanine dehydrogenase